MIKQHHVAYGAMAGSVALALVVIGIIVYIFYFKKHGNNSNNQNKTVSSESKLPKKPVLNPSNNTLLDVMKTGTSDMPGYFERDVQVKPGQWNPTENNGNSQALVSKLCSDMYWNTPDLFHNRYASMGECELDHRMLPLGSQPNNLDFVCKKYGDKFADCKNNPLWAVTGVEYSKC